MREKNVGFNFVRLDPNSGVTLLDPGFPEDRICCILVI